jgi:filamin
LGTGEGHCHNVISIAGPEDIFNGNLKLIMGLIWTLIGRYQIRSTGRALSTKEAMLAWVNTQIPHKEIKNFTKDWNDGTALCALVDRIQPGLISHHATLNQADKLKNCTLGMGLAQDKLNIPKLLDPEDLSHPDVDEISVMTYISNFCEPANAHLLKWVQAMIPRRNIKNFSKDWNDGVNLACLLEALNPGGFPNCEKLDPHHAIDNLAQGMKKAEDQLGIKPILKPDQMADPSVDELNVVTYLSRFQNAKPLPQPQAISCDGEGLRKAIVGHAAAFEVDATKGGSGDLDVVITCDRKPLAAKVTPNFGKKAIYSVNYTPTTSGLVSISIKWSGTEIPTSPYSVNVVDPKAVSMTGPEISGQKCARVGQKVVMEVKGVADITDMEVKIKSPTGHLEEAKLVSKSKGVIECSYIPRVVGTDQVEAKVAGISISGSPFSVKVTDPKVLSVTLREPPSEKPLLINGKATFVVSAEKGSVEGVEAKFVSPSGSKDVPLKTEKAGSSIGVVSPAAVGDHEIRVTCGGESIKGSPINLKVCDPSKCVLDNLPKYLIVGDLFDARLTTKGAGVGSAEARSSNTGVLDLACKEGADRNYNIKLTPRKVGESSVSVDWNGLAVPKTPHEISVCDPTKCTALGPGLAEGKGKTKEPFNFTVHTTGGGKGELRITPKGPKNTLAADITKVSDAKYSVSFTTFETGDHTIEILWCGKNIPNSPYTVNFYKPAAANTFTATGDGLKVAVAMKPAKVMIVGPEAGLLTKNILKISIGNGTINSTMVTKAKFKPETGKSKAMMFASDDSNGAYSVEYLVPTAGKYSLSITSDGEDIPGSPYSVNVLPAPDANKCKAFGTAIDNPVGLMVGKPLEFKVDSTDAGTGELSVTCKDPKGSNISVFLAEDSTTAPKRIHSVKIDVNTQGKYEVVVLWSGKGIPKSPFTFQACDPKEVIIIDLPNCADYVGRVGDPLSFSVDTKKAGVGELKGEVKYEDGKVETLTQKKNKDGTIKLSHTPNKVGKMELLLTFSGANILKTPWTTEIADPNAFEVIPPRDPTKVTQYVKFVINGLKKKEAKKIVITAKNKTHDATVKIDFNDQGVAVARFTAKEIGEYNVAVKVANNDVPGSPFKCPVVNPDVCTIRGDVPTVIPVGVTKEVAVNTSNAGPGDLIIESTDGDGAPSNCLVSTVSAGEKKTVKMTGKVCGKISLNMKYAGFPIPSMPKDVYVTNPSKCGFTCKGIDKGLCKTDGSVTVDIDTTQGGNCPPELAIKGPKSKYDTELKKVTEGRYTTTFSPWQDGRNTIQVTVGGSDVAGSPMNFESRKPLDINKVTVSGPGLAGAVANRRAEVVIYARESMLVDKGVLGVAFKDGAVRDFEVYDKQNGTYNVTFTPEKTGSLQLLVTGDGESVGGSPFNIPVASEPDAAKCEIKNRAGEEIFKDSSSVYHPVRTSFEIGVVTTDAGHGKLVATGKSPNKSQIRVFTNAEKSKGKDITYIKFDPSNTGVYTLSLQWDGKDLKGSPYNIKVIDPSKCIFADPFPSCVKLGGEVQCEVETSSAGKGELEAFVKGPEAEVSIAEKSPGVSVITVRGVVLGSTSVDLKFGGLTVGSSPYALVVCDPTQCIVDFTPGIYNINMPVKFMVKTAGAGRAKLQLTSSMKGSSVVRNINESTMEAVFTPKEMGDHQLRLLWGEWDIGESPYTITVCDPKRVKYDGVPHPNDVLPMGEPVTFTVDTSQAGAGTLLCRVKTDNGTPEDVNMEETDSTPGITSMQFIPKSPGKVQLVLEFNGMDILQRPHVYSVPDPSQFEVTPPKGCGRVNELVKFSVTGVSRDTQLSITATHPEANSVEVHHERGADASLIVGHMTPKLHGVYTVSVKHADQNISGSPFTVPVCDPDACKFIGEIPSYVHVGEEPNIQVDTSEAGPGDLTFNTAMAGVEQGLPVAEDNKAILLLDNQVGMIRVDVCYGGYHIPHSPLMLTILDSQRVTWSCPILDTKDSLMQGDVMKIHIDGSEAGETVPEVIAMGPNEEYPVKMADNEDGTFVVTLSAWQIGRNEVKIRWGGMAIPDTPLVFNVTKGVEARAITLSGLDGAVALCESIITINALEPGLVKQGLLVAKFELGDDEDEEDLPTYSVTDKGEGKYCVTFEAPKEGIYTLSIKYDDNHIPNSPFSVKVSAPSDAAQCRAYGEALQKVPALFIADYPVKFSVDTSKAGEGSLSISAVRPDDEPMYVYTMEEGSVHHLKFDPVLTGHHVVDVKWGGVHIPGSPFDFNTVDPSKCILEGTPQEGSHHGIEETIDFSALITGIGECTPEVKASAKEETIDIECSEATEEALKFSYKPKTFGKTSISVTVGGEHVPKSPINFFVTDPNLFSVTGISIEGDYAIVCEPVTLEITGQASEDEDILVTAHGPSADLSVETTQKEDNFHTATFVPIEPGSYEVFVEYARAHVAGSPLTVKVADPSKCQPLGGMLSNVQVGEQGEITVKTRGAGEGELKALVRHEDEDSPALDCEVKDLGLDTYTIFITGKKIGKATIDLQWAGFSIPSSPFRVIVSDAGKCKAHGEVLETRKGKAGSPILFSVDTDEAGEGELEVTAKGPSAQYTVNVSDLGETSKEVSFTPWEIGEHKIEVLWGKGGIPGSPFSVNVGSPLEMEICNATGDGLKHGIATQKTTFTIICSDAGLLEKDVLKVDVKGVKTHPEVVLVDNNNGCYTVEYTAPIPGAYVAAILYHGRHIQGSPFKITVDSGPDASKCKAYGPALHPNALAIAGSPLEFFVDTASAGYGNLKVYIQGPGDYKPRVFMADDEKGIYSIKFDAMKAGKYFILVVWSEKHIPNSPFKIRVHPAANAGKVKAYGPGLLDSFIGTPGQFNVETKNAGIGTLLVRIHGLKDSFKVEAHPLSENDPRTLIVTYNPKLVGQYTIFVRWSGVHVPGSSFTVNIKQKPG